MTTEGEQKTKKRRSKKEKREAVQPDFRVSVRSLIAFSFFEKDILPSSGSMALMQAGTRAHQQRQRAQSGETERPIQQTVACMGESVSIYGRMDAYTPGEIPHIEEIKLSEGGQSLTAPYPDHRAQAVVYAAMVALEHDAKQVSFAVTYVSEQGEVLNAFEETLSRECLLAELYALLEPYVAFEASERSHRKARNESLAELAFPFPQYRAGQREMAAQVYTAIARGCRLFASLPTGTGKSAAVLFPALKALGQDKTGKLLYLTARTTARQSPLHALERMLAQGMRARVMTLTAKEKLCPGYARCHPKDCPRAAGHYVRERDGVEDIRQVQGIWTDELILQVAEKHDICPFEFALALTEIADVVLMDVNYAFDPFAQVKRLFHFRRDLTILADEAHHLVERVRESLSGEMDSGVLRDVRVRFGKEGGRKHPYYAALTKAVNALRAIGAGGAERVEAIQEEPPKAALPDGVATAVYALCEETMKLLGSAAYSSAVMEDVGLTLRFCSAFLQALERFDEDYAILVTPHGKERKVELYCLLPAKEIARVTRRLCGAVFFSATMAPLSATKLLLGGGEEDACFGLPSPFPPENLRVIRRDISTRYLAREQSAGKIAEYIAEAACSRAGKYIAYFPSYAYLRMVRERLEAMQTPPLWVQRADMNEAERLAFLEGFTVDEAPKLGLCVLGSLFSEGIDLPGEQLIGVMIVGVGLPVPTPRLRAVQECYQKHFGDGFAYACRIPGMQKVLQAAGRVIRGETDTGLVMLLDDRYFDMEYLRLLPEEWQLTQNRGW